MAVDALVVPCVLLLSGLEKDLRRKEILVFMSRGDDHVVKGSGGRIVFIFPSPFCFPLDFVVFTKLPRKN